MSVVTVENVRGSLRYKLITVDKSNFYLMDTQSSIFFLILPFLKLFFRNKFYKIDSTTYHHLINADYSAKGVGVNGLASISIVSVLISRFIPISSWKLDNVVLSYIILSLIFVAVSYFRWKSARTPSLIKEIIMRNQAIKIKMYYTDLTVIFINFIIIICISLMYYTLKKIVFFGEQYIIFYGLLFFGYLGYTYSSLMFYSVGKYNIKDN
ncbi:DUF443 family protein [Streptococcus suis]|nr:DUF443 family protein [Streptococcus suis]